MSHRFDVEIHAYVLMDNHYHLLLKTNRPNLSKSMQWFGTTYTRRYNSAHGRSGHLFQGRFKNHLECDMDKIRESLRFDSLEKEKRDMLCICYGSPVNTAERR